MERRNWVGERMGRGTWVGIGRAGMRARKKKGSQWGASLEQPRDMGWRRLLGEDMIMTLAETTSNRKIWSLKWPPPVARQEFALEGGRHQPTLRPFYSKFTMPTRCTNMWSRD